MKNRILTLLILSSLFLSGNVLADEKKSFLDDVKLSGMFEYYNHMSLENAQSSLPFHRAYYAKIFLDKSFQNGLKIKFTLFPYTQSICFQYMYYNQLDYRLYFEYSAEFENLFEYYCRIGDLERTTLGQGLTYDQMEFEGVDVILTRNKMQLQVQYFAVGFTGQEDHIVLRLSPKSIDAGINGIFTLQDSNSPIISNPSYIVSLDWSLLILKYFKLYNELAINLIPEQDTNGTAGLIGANYEYSNKSTSIDIGVEGRLYNADFNIPFVNNLGGNVYHGIDSQDKKVNNWRNYLLHDGYLTGFYAYCNIRQKLFKIKDHIVSLFLLGEYLDIVHSLDTEKFHLYSVGIDFGFSKDISVIIGLSNKAMPGYGNTLDDNKSMFVIHSHLQAKVVARF